MLYKTTVLLVPLGDDFTYITQTGFKGQFRNYERLFKYMNSNPEMNVHVRWYLFLITSFLSIFVFFLYTFIYVPTAIANGV